jgi:glutaredoxin
MATPTEALIDELIAKHPIQVFSKTTCPYCIRVGDFFKQLEVPYNHTELDLMGPEGAEIQATLAKRTGQSTVPSVWINKKFIGGCDSVMHLHRRKQLIPALKEAGLSPVG